MRTYTPDRWVMLKIHHKGEVICKVLAGWSGSYLQGSSWKLNSGCVSATETETHYCFEGYSGSAYKCAKQGYGLTMLTAEILAGFTSKTPSGTITMLPETSDFIAEIGELDARPRE